MGLVRQTAAGWLRLSELSQVQGEEALQSCRDVAETVYPGLDLSGEIGATYAQGLGDIVLVEGARDIAASAPGHAAAKGFGALYPRV